MRAYGVRGLQAHVKRGIDLGETLEAKLRTRPDLFTILTSAHFGLLTLRLNDKSDSARGDGQTINSGTRTLCDSINGGGRFYLSSTIINGKYAIRVCTSGASAHEEHIQELFELLVAKARKLIERGALCS